MIRRLNENYFFLAVICAIFAVGLFTLIRTPKWVSVSENRSLDQFKPFTISSFIDGSFQDNFEKALSDQFVLSEKVRVGYGDLINNLPTFGIDNMVCGNHYIVLNYNNSYAATYNCDDRLVALPINEDPNTAEIFKSDILDKNIEKYNKINTISDVYYYYIDQQQLFNFETGEKIIELDKYLKDHLTGNYSFADMTYNSYDEFVPYFYKTDHHWNKEGQYKGYREIMELLGEKDILEPVGTVTNHDNFYGSFARELQNYKYKEEFEIYNFDLPEHDTYIDEKPGQYGHYQEYLTHDYVYDRSSNLYGYVYGLDNGEVLFDYHQPKKDNLLIIADSFDNPINVLIAKSFNKTYSIDLRNYELFFKKPFALSSYLEGKDIDKILFIVSPRFLYDEKSNKGLEL